MYQYYNSEPKDILINAKKQYHKDDIPFVTQLFTSDWIVKYLTENTLGRYWKEANPEFNIPDDWKFYIDEVEDEKNPHKLSPESIKVFDPCMGSGHILVYSFEILMKIYDSCGYSQRDAAKLILEKNIYGLDIDKRAYQLAYFSLLMQARKYNRRILNSAININLACIEDAEKIDSAVLDRLGKEKITAQKLIDIFKNAKEYGSLLYLDGKTEINELSVKLNDLDDKNEYHNLIDYMDNSMIISTLKPLLKQAEILSNKYDVVITNPPYMATKYMTPKLKEYVSDRFKEYKSDLFASFLIRCSDFCISDGHIGMLTPYVWMFIQSYVELRKYIYNNMTFSSLIQLEFNAFESACVPVAAFTFRNKKTTLPFEAIRLSEFKGINVQEVKTLEAIKDRNCGFRFTAQQEEFSNIPGSPVAYWVSHNMFNAFKTKKLGDLAKPRQGITDKLNSEFASDVRKLVFWYDANAEFQEDIDSIELENAKVLHLEPDNQFYIKYFLEREDTTTNYLVYAPFAKPSIRDNHLADTIRYSKEFFADRASLLTLDLGIDERYKPVIQHYIKFFANKDRTQKFYDLEIENFNRSTIEVALMSVLCKDKTASFEEVLRSILTDDGLQDNKYLAEFEKYDLLSAFWQQADVAFGYNDPKPTLEKLVITMFVTYAAKSIHTDMPQAWKPFISYKFGNIIAFMDNLMNSYLYGTRFDKISEIIYNAINGKNYLEKMEIETLVDCNIFAGVDELLISWIIGRLENEDIGAKLNGKTIPELCVERRKQHFGKNFRSEYFILQNAFDMIAEGKYQPVSGIKNLVKEYTETTYKIDRYYRYFYFYFDKLEDTTQFEKIRELVENIYTNEYLNRITVNWNNELADADAETGLALQRDFFTRHINYSKDRVKL